MCLQNVNKTYKGAGKKARIGYKVFEPSPKGYAPQYSFYIGPKRIRGRKWINERAYRGFKYREYLRSSRNHRTYPTGWHLLGSKKDARCWLAGCANSRLVIVKVKYRKVVAKGEQRHIGVIVAKEIYVLNRIQND